MKQDATPTGPFRHPVPRLYSLSRERGLQANISCYILLWLLRGLTICNIPRLAVKGRAVEAGAIAGPVNTDSV